MRFLQIRGVQMKSSCLSIILAIVTTGICVGQQSSENSGPKKMWCQYEANREKANGKHVLLIAGDDEYRSEEALPMLGKILATHHGFKCTVLFPTNDKGVIQPDFQENIPGMHHLKSADVIILGLRFRNLPDKDMELFDQYLESGKPIIALRTSTHAFRIPKNRKYAKYSFNSKKDWIGGFGQQILGDTWISHHGKHGKQSTRGVVNEVHKEHPILSGVSDVWGTTDVYGIKHLPKTANILLFGQVLDGMKPDSEPVKGKINDPMMPLAWTTTYSSKAGHANRIVCTTMGAATDFESKGLRRMIVNATYWCLDMAVSEKPVNVDYVGNYNPTNFGFGNYQKGRTATFYDLVK